MNIYEVVKKSFISKLFVFALASGISFATIILPLLIPLTASAQSATSLGTPPPGWKVYPTEVTYENRLTPGLFLTMDFVRNNLGLGTFDNGELTSVEVKGHVGENLNDKLTEAGRPTIDPKSIFTITTKVNGQNVTNYYQDNRLIAVARKDGLYIPPKDIIKLQDISQDNSNDLNTEAGINNWFDTRDKVNIGDTTRGIRGRDQGNINNLLQQQDGLNEQIASKKKELAETTDPVKKAQLQTELNGLQQQLDQVTQNLQTAQVTNNNKINTSTCNEHWYSIITLECMQALIAVLANMYLNLVSYALGLVGTLFDFSIEIAVNSAEFVERIGVVNPIWSFIRDMLNMTFIFILLWIAANIILGKRNYTVRSNVVKVVIVAILINFSLFAAKLLIDGSNLLTLQIYEAVKGGTSATRPPISAQIMDTLGMPTMYNFSDIASGETIEGCGGANGTIITVAIFGSIFMIILGLAFLFGAVLFFSRMANIIYLFITSPLWVWGHIMDTGIFRRSRESWQKKMEQAVKFPVIYMMFIFVGMFAFVKLIGLRNNQGLSFLTLFCISRDKSLIGQLPLIMNFCLVIWVMLNAIRYGIKNGAGPEGASLGFTRKFNDSVGKRFGKWAENTWKKPLDFSTGKAKQLGKGVGAAAAILPRRAVTRVANGVSAATGRVAESADTPTWIRNLAGKISDKVKDPKVFGKTQKQSEEDWKKLIEGKAAANTNRTLDVALASVGDAPKFDPEKDRDKGDMERKVAEYAQRTAGVFLKSGILNTDGNREKIIAAAMAGIKEETDESGNKTYKFNQAQMRQKIADIRKDYMPNNGKGNRTHHTVQRFNPYDRLLQARFAARDKAITSRATSMITSDGKTQGKQDESPEALKAKLKQHEEDLKKYPLNMDQLEVLLATDPKALKGVGNAAKINQTMKDIAEKEQKLKDLESVVEGFDEFGEVRKDHTQINKTKEEIEKKKSEVAKAKKAILDQREKIQKSINTINKKLESKDKDKDGKKGS